MTLKSLSAVWAIFLHRPSWCVFAVSADDVREAGKEFQSSRKAYYLVNTSSSSSACVCVCLLLFSRRRRRIKSTSPLLPMWKLVAAAAVAAAVGIRHLTVMKRDRSVRLATPPPPQQQPPPPNVWCVLQQQSKSVEEEEEESFFFSSAPSPSRYIMQDKFPFPVSLSRSC